MQEVGPGHAFAPVLPAKEARTLAGRRAGAMEKADVPERTPSRPSPTTSLIVSKRERPLVASERGVRTRRIAI
jgi:hypothetical protein